MSTDLEFATTEQIIQELFDRCEVLAMGYQLKLDDRSGQFKYTTKGLVHQVVGTIEQVKFRVLMESEST